MRMAAVFPDIIAKELQLKSTNVASTVRLLQEGATVPFISRYRKEATGSLDEVQVGQIKERLQQLQQIVKRKETILQTIKESDQLTPELEQRINQTWDLNTLEDIYLPYKPKRKTRASEARRKGLEPLAGSLMKQELQDVEHRASYFVKGEVKDIEEALQGARDIMAEWINERERARNTIRRLFQRRAVISSKLIKGKDEEGQKYKDYFAFSEPLQRCRGHRLMAILRGENEGILRVNVAPDEAEALEKLEQIFIKGRNEASDQVKLAVKDSYKRLLKPSIETETRKEAKAKADEEAIGVFSENLRQLLLAPPLGQVSVLAIDPGFRTGCKVVCLDKQGNLKHNETIFPHAPQKQTDKAASKISTLVNAYKIEAIAIGNGTAGRETEAFVKKRVRLPREVQVFMVNEAGASIYSASSIAREEFPGYDVTVRGAVSIGRRLIDPLAELVKIDPKSIGVGQYQHDVDQTRLKESLTTVVESCVNSVGINLNTASKHLLTFVSGLGPKTAEAIVDERTNNGGFQQRKQLLKVAGLGPKAYEQCAGFLRIKNGDKPLDNSAVHPESYAVVSKMAKDKNQPVEALIRNNELLDTITLQDYVTANVGLPTLKDIISELKKPGLDPRGKAKTFAFADHIRGIEDLQPGMVLPAIITNITNFGAFADIGVKQDGLIHVSQLADKFVSDPTEVVHLQQQVQVKVLEVDVSRKRITLSMKEV